MAKIIGKTEFARRVAAMGMTLVEFQKHVPYSLNAIQSVSSGYRAMSDKMRFILETVEEKKRRGDI